TAGTIGQPIRTRKGCRECSRANQVAEREMACSFWLSYCTLQRRRRCSRGDLDGGFSHLGYPYPFCLGPECKNPGANSNRQTFFVGSRDYCNRCRSTSMERPHFRPCC